MGSTISTPEDFELGGYWLGKDVNVARKGLTMHFKERMVKSHSKDDLQAFLDSEREKDQITVLYNPESMKAIRILVG